MSEAALEFDVIIIGGGPAGLACAIHTKQLAAKHHKNISVCLLEKSAAIGGHILSGAVLEPRALDELMPDWRHQQAPIDCPVTTDQFCLLTAKRHYRLPTPPQMNNHGNHIIRLGALCRWLGEQAQALGVEIFPGFNAAEAIIEQQQVRGVVTGAFGLDKDGQTTDNFQPGMRLLGKQTVFAEGARGFLTEPLIEQFNLRQHTQNQTYGLGVKELWQIPGEQHDTGTVIHTVGWPLNNTTYGGSFLYYLAPDLVSVGLVVGLDYPNPYLDPYAELQRFKTHPWIAPRFAKGRLVSYGARVINEGGWQSVPQLTIPGGLLIGCSAGFVNVPKIKGIHTAMKSGMLAAQTIVNHADTTAGTQLTAYQQQLNQSWLAEELRAVRNIRPAFQWGLWPGLAYSALDTYLLRGRAPWTFKHVVDHQQLKPARHYQPIVYPKADGQLTWDKLTALSYANTQHQEQQAAHLKIDDHQQIQAVNHARYDNPETRYCPAGVYEWLEQDGQPRLQINAANCLHCKACDIKDPGQNIHWTLPEGGSGPNYVDL